MSLWKPLFSLGTLVGAAWLAVKLVEKYDAQKSAQWSELAADLGAEPLKAEQAERGMVFRTEFAADRPAAQTQSATPAADNAPSAAQTPAQPATQAQQPRPGYLDPTTIACAEDFQDWDALGCRS